MGVSPEREIDGVDLSDHFLGKTEDFPNDTFIYWCGQSLQAVRVGDSSREIVGREQREIGRVENATTLTHHDENYPYMVAMYDLADMPTMAG